MVFGLSGSFRFEDYKSMAKCFECFFCKEKDELSPSGEKVKRCSVTGRTLTDESEACANIMRKS